MNRAAILGIIAFLAYFFGALTIHLINKAEVSNETATVLIEAKSYKELYTEANNKIIAPDSPYAKTHKLTEEQVTTNNQIAAKEVFNIILKDKGAKCALTIRHIYQDDLAVKLGYKAADYEAVGFICGNS